MRFFVKAPFYYLFLTLVVFSCKKNTTEVNVDVDCGCDGSTYLTIENLQARHSGNGYFVINKIDTNGNLTYAWACDVDSTWEVSTVEKTWNYTISGNLKKRCPVENPEFTSMSPGGPMQITFLEKNN